MHIGHSLKSESYILFSTKYQWNVLRLNLFFLLSDPFFYENISYIVLLKKLR
jgi:hypothetical protein